jgi:transcriptional regulator with XRE-family HTH domain
MGKGKREMAIGEKIKELRQAKGLTQKELGESIGANNSNVCQWETGHCEPTIFSCILLADVFNISLDELCCRDFKGDENG